MNYSWDTIRDQVRDFRTNLQAIYPLQILSTVKEFTIDASNQLYFLSDHLALTNEISPSRNLQLYHVDLNKIPYSDWLNKSDRMTEAEYLAACSKASLLEWNVLFEEYCNPKTGTHFRLQSITSYDIKDDTVMFTSHNGIFISKMEQIPRLVYSRSMHVGNTQSTERYPTSKTLLLDGRLDPKLGGNHADKIAFIKNRDIWVMDLEGNERQLTFCSLNTKDPTLNCGGVEYMMQEEFHRFTGYYWAPSDPDSPVDRIVYLETSELEVELLRISKPAISFSGSDTLLNHTECMRYPYAGKPNATSKIRIVEFSDTEIIHRKLLDHDELHIAFPWMEYIVRFGWIPNGQSVWAQILSRDQKRTAIVKLALEQFISSSSSLSAEILWEETNSAWINVTDAYYFMKQTDATVTRLIWSSEKSNGYRHLYLVEKHIDQPAIITQLTHGEWCCLDKPIYVDESRGLVYFSAKADTPLEPHFYVVSYIRPQDGIKRLTQPGFSHTVTMTCPDYFVDCFSNLHHPHIFSVQKIDHSSLLPSISSYKGLILPVCRITPYQNSSPCIANTLFLHTNSPAAENIKHYEEATLIYESVLSNGHLFSFTTSDGIYIYIYIV
ncbi:hypothetical protein RMATCC62417_05541 [Rhizopus microsporus]|nr:hypothetical protein RMATCC62417_05541 [Rhizopus microsporus]